MQVRTHREMLQPIRSGAFAFAHARHLLLRLGFGGTPDQVALITEWGPERAVDYFLSPSPEGFRADSPPSGIRSDIMQPLSDDERRAFRQAQRRGDENTLAQYRARRMQAQRQDRGQVRDIQKWWLARMIESPAALQEKMTLFWHGHFATSYRTIENSWHMLEQNRLFRRHALGSYADLMYAIIRDPAMIAYLDNNDSRKGMPNENLARELMELFGLGVGNYAERDIKEGARALTGYTFEYNDFVFRRERHDGGHKRILGAAGNLDGDDFVTAILRKRQCSEFIAAKLYRFFIGDLADDWQDRRSATPKPLRDYVEALAGTLRRARYDVKPVLREMFLSAHFYADEIVGQQVKSPVELVVGSVRQLLTPARDMAVLLDAMDLMGQHLFFPPSVAGWAGGRSWINTSTLFTRQNAAAYLLTGASPNQGQGVAGSRYNPRQIVTPIVERTALARSNKPDDLAAGLLTFCLGRAPDQARRVVAKHLAEHPGDTGVIGALLLITAMPEYQLC